jgi:hypothetical protein
MNSKIFVLSISILLPMIAACTPDQINSAIQSCRGNPECYEIIDSAIEEELADRGIVGGKMTNIELNNVYSFLEEFLLTEAGPMTAGKVAMLNDFGYPPTDGDLYFVQRMLYHEDSSGIPNDLFDFKNLNTENKQKVIHLGNKYLIYKVGSQQYRYEVYRSRSYILNIDLELSAFYWQDKKFVTPALMIEQMLNNYYPDYFARLTSTEEFYITNALNTTSYSDSGDFEYFTNGALGFYSKLNHNYYSIFATSSFFPNDRYEYRAILSKRSGLNSVSFYECYLGDSFDGSINEFLDMVISGEGIEIAEWNEETNNEDVLHEFKSHVANIENYSFKLKINSATSN